jgi:hypothetical protein
MSPVTSTASRRPRRLLPSAARHRALAALALAALTLAIIGCDRDPAAPPPVAPFFDVQLTGALDSGFTGTGYLTNGPDASAKYDSRADSVLRLMLIPGNAPPGAPSDPFVPESFVRIWLAHPGPLGPNWVGRYAVGPGEPVQATLVPWRTNGGTHQGYLYAIDGELEITAATANTVSGQLSATVIGSLDGFEGAPDTVQVRSQFHLAGPTGT